MLLLTSIEDTTNRAGFMIKDQISPTSLGETIAMQQARTEIENLRRWYAIATDKLGQADDANAKAEGLDIYHRIFTATADVKVSGVTAKALHGTGPDAWAQVASNALQDYRATQHLIGTQVVTFSSLVFSTEKSNGMIDIAAGRATMSSYLQAWHAWPNRRLRLVMGTYLDELVYSPDIGWQISSMDLVHVSGEQRQLGDPS